MNNKTILAGVLVALLGVGCASPPPPAPAAACSLNIPLPPDPLPASFDWTPLARNWCAQLAACGYPPQGCVQDYLDEIQSGPAAPAPVSGVGTETVSEQVVCEDSLEAQTNPAICSPVQQQRRREPRY